jgi:hypothetical protein
MTNLRGALVRIDARDGDVVPIVLIGDLPLSVEVARVADVNLGAKLDRWALRRFLGARRQRNQQNGR